MKRLLYFKSAKDFWIKLIVSQLLLFLGYLLFPSGGDYFAISSSCDAYLIVAGLAFLIMTYGYLYDVVADWLKSRKLNSQSR